MSSFKMQMRLFTNQSIQTSENNRNQITQQNITRTLQNQNSFIKLGYNGINRNYAALMVQGEKYCKSCNDKK